VYSTLLFFPATQICCSEGEDELEFFDGVLGYVSSQLPYLCCYGVFRCSVSLKVILVFKDIIYVIIILYIYDIWLSVSTFNHICRTIDPISYIQWVLNFNIKTGYDIQLTMFSISTIITRHHTSSQQKHSCWVHSFNNAPDNTIYDGNQHHLEHPFIKAKRLGYIPLVCTKIWKHGVHSVRDELQHGRLAWFDQQCLLLDKKIFLSRPCGGTSSPQLAWPCHQ
jgi:hypothetical protein